MLTRRRVCTVQIAAQGGENYEMGSGAPILSIYLPKVPLAGVPSRRPANQGLMKIDDDPMSARVSERVSG